MGAARATGEQRLVGIRHIGDGDQGIAVIVQADAAYPPSAHVFRDDLLCNQLGCGERVGEQGVDGGAAFFARDGCHCRIGCYRLAVAIAHRHLGELERYPQRNGVGEFGRSGSGQDGSKVAHAVLVLLVSGLMVMVSMVWVMPPCQLWPETTMGPGWYG